MAMDTAGIGRTATDHTATVPGVITATRFMGRTAMVAIILITTAAADFRRLLLRLHRHLLSHPDSKKVGDQILELLGTFPLSGGIIGSHYLGGG